MFHIIVIISKALLLNSQPPGSAVLTWSWNGRLVSAGDMKVYTDDRLQVKRQEAGDRIQEVKQIRQDVGCRRLEAGGKM